MLLSFKNFFYRNTEQESTSIVQLEGILRAAIQSGESLKHELVIRTHLEIDPNHCVDFIQPRHPPESVEKENKVRAYFSHLNSQPSYYLPTEECLALCEDLGVNEQVLLHSGGDWRVILFSACAIEEDSEFNLRRRADVFYFRRRCSVDYNQIKHDYGEEAMQRISIYDKDNTVDIKGWSEIMPDSALAKVVGWSMSRGGRLSMSKIIKILDLRTNIIGAE